MNWDIVEGKWDQFKGSAQKKWGKITNDEMDVVAGNQKKLAGKIQEKYGYTREKAEEEAEHWRKSLKK